MERERKTGVRDGPKVVGLVTGRKELLSDEMGKAVARASLGEDQEVDGSLGCLPTI